MEEGIMKIIVDLLKSKKIRFGHYKFDDCLIVYFDSSVGYIQINDDEIGFYSELEESGDGENLYYSNLKFSSIDTLIIELDKFILEMGKINGVLFTIKKDLKIIKDRCEKHKINFYDLISIQNKSLEPIN